MSKEQDKKTDKKAENPKISKHDFYFETPLYQKINYSELENSKDLLHHEVDAYSAVNNIETTYSIEPNWLEQYAQEKDFNGKWELIYIGIQQVTLTCKRKANDKPIFFVFNDQINKFIMKIGQIPSISTLQFSDIEKKYEKVLEQKLLDEFKKSINSASHGYGVAAFVYLRRIFENLILDTFKISTVDYETKLKDFVSLRMEEKIDQLKDHLPSQLVEMKSIYGILSLGIHELTEEKCLAFFVPLKLSIELILDQKIEEDLKKKRDSEVKKQIALINTSLKSNKE